MKFRVDEVVAATGGRLLAGRPDASAGKICTNSRTLERGQTFLALRGERFDGHAFLGDAVERGAACLVVDNMPGDGKPAVDGRTAVVLVKDTAAALTDLGRAARARLSCPVIAVTGSCGKTTVKEMIGQVLARRLRGRRPPASFNNQIGVPLTLLAAEPDDGFVLCEFGTNSPGEIEHLASVGRPTIGVVTVVAPVHLEGLGTIEGVAREKGALVEAIPPEGLVILNADDARVAAMARRCSGRVVTVGMAPEADLRILNVEQAAAGLTFSVSEGDGKAPLRFRVPVYGVHQATLAVAAAAAAREAGVPLEETAAALGEFQPPPMRLDVQDHDGVTVINDAYNANPRSMRAALDLLALWPTRRKVFFAGDMRELGPESRVAHEILGRSAVESGVAQLICVGPESLAACDGAVAAGLARKAVTTLADSAEAAKIAPTVVRQGDVVLVKGSRTMKMERVAEAIAAARKG
jgi:UDP-N-acetylmuramoyl-tripeptide--D-alanyl-D-alanine ligase